MADKKLTKEEIMASPFAQKLFKGFINSALGPGDLGGMKAKTIDLIMAKLPSPSSSSSTSSTTSSAVSAPSAQKSRPKVSVSRSSATDLKDKLVSAKKSLGFKSGGTVKRTGKASRPCKMC